VRTALGIQRGGAAQETNGLLRLALIQRDLAELEERVRLTIVYFDRAQITLARLVVLMPLLINQAKLLLRVGILRIGGRDFQLPFQVLPAA
jgi:hypothetical protein